MSLRNRTWLMFLLLALPMAAPAQGQETPPVAPAPGLEEPAPAPVVPAEAAPEPTPPAAAAEPQPGEPDPILQRMVDRGLENVVVQRSRDTIRVAYENRRYRWNVTGLGVALSAAAREAPEGTTLIVTPNIWGVPEFEVEVPADDYRRFLEGSLTEKELAPRFQVRYGRGGRPRGGANKSFRRVDLTAGLGFRASFTTEDPDEGVHGRLLVGLETALLPGIGLTAQETVPLDRDRPFVTQARLSGVLHPTGSLFLALSGGRLTEDLDAVQGEVAWMARSGRRSLRMTYTAGRDQFFRTNAHSALVTLTQYIGRHDIAISLVGGRFWEGDRGAELLLQSGFRERRIVVGGGRSGGVTRTRIQLILPLGPRVQPEPRQLRFKIRDTFNARYRAPKGLITEARVGGVVPPSLLEERTMLFSPEIARTYLKELRRSADLLQQ